MLMRTMAVMNKKCALAGKTTIVKTAERQTDALDAR
jgi:hypothetical protein